MQLYIIYVGGGGGGGGGGGSTTKYSSLHTWDTSIHVLHIGSCNQNSEVIIMAQADISETENLCTSECVCGNFLP